MTTEFKSIEFEAKNLADDGTFTGYASVFDNVDSYNDVIVKGAFQKTISKKSKTGRPAFKMLWQHNAKEPIGVYTSAKEDDTGLLVEGQINLDTVKGREAHSLLKQGGLDGLSIGYMVDDSHVDSKKGIRYLKAIDLKEVSLVTFPANEQALITEVRNEDITHAEVVELLKENGVTQEKADLIASYGVDYDKILAKDLLNAIKGLK